MDVENGTWREVPSECSGEMMPRSGLSASLIDTSIYVIGGHHDFTIHNNVFLLKTERPIERKEVFAQGSFLQDVRFLWENRQFCDLTLVKITICMHIYVLYAKPLKNGHRCLKDTK